MDGHLAATGLNTSDEYHHGRIMYHFDCAQVLTINGRPAGLLKVRRTPLEWEIVQIQLTQPLQDKGVGRSLLEQVVAEAIAAGATIKLSVLKSNPAKHLYERLKFKVVGETEHACIMLRAV